MKKIKPNIHGCFRAFLAGNVRGTARLSEKLLEWQAGREVFGNVSTTIPFVIAMIRVASEKRRTNHLLRI
jgi:hypothetical protein